MKQLNFEKSIWLHRFSHGGVLRKKRAGRKARPLSSKEALHLVLKSNKETIKNGLRTHRRFFLIHQLLERYAKKFFIKVEQVSIQGDHIHLILRLRKRSQCQNFFRVFTGQIAQRFQNEGLMNSAVTDRTKKGDNRDVTDAPKNSDKAVNPLKLWKYRPFTRVLRGWKNFKTAMSYVRLNEKEALGDFDYKKDRLRGLTPDEWEALWC